MLCLLVMRLSGCCIIHNSSLGITVQALIPTVHDDSNRSKLSAALVTPDSLSMRNTTPGNSQQVDSVDLILANIYFSSTFDASFDKWLCTDAGVRAGIREMPKRNGENEEQGQGGREMYHLVLDLSIKMQVKGDGEAIRQMGFSSGLKLTQKGWFC